MKYPQSSLNIITTLEQAGHTTRYAGGCVRDTLMGIVPNDYDLATAATPDEVEQLFEKTIPVGKAFGVMIVVQDGQEYEVATFRKDSADSDGRRPSNVEFSDINTDALRRDFTINGMFAHPNRDVWDIVGGQKDITNKLIRFIGDPNVRIKEDSLRLLRAVRFAIRFGFEIEPKSMLAIQQLSKNIMYISKERVRDELFKMVMLEQPRRMLNLLDKTNLLQHVLPSIYKLKNETQNPVWHPEGTVYEHVIKTMEALVYTSLELQLAGLFHDVGKPNCRTINATGIHHYEHDLEGAKITTQILTDLKCTRQMVVHVSTLVELHMRLTHFTEMKMSKQKRLVSNKLFEDLLRLRTADIKGSHGDLSSIKEITDIISSWKCVSKSEIAPCAFVTGKRLIKMGMVSGPQMGKLITKAYNMQLENVSEEDIMITIQNQLGNSNDCV